MSSSKEPPVGGIRLVASNRRAGPTWSSASASARLHSCHVGPPTCTICVRGLTSLASLDVWELKGHTVGVTNFRGIVRRATSEDLHAVLELDRIAPVGHERG